MILAAGKGERMSPLTEKLPKALLNVAGKTLIEWTIDRFIKANIHDIVVAVGWKGSLIEQYVLNSNIDVSITHVPDYEIGPLQTFLTAIETFDGDFLVTPVDALLEPSSLLELQAHHSSYPDHVGMTLAVGYSSNVGTPVELNEKGFVTSFGKDGSGKNSLVKSAMQLISNTRIRGLCRSSLKEGKQRVVEVLDQFIKNGNAILSYNVSDRWFDIDTLSDILVTNRYMLERGWFSKPDSVFVPVGDSIEVGDVLSLSPNITIEKGSVLQGPILISSDCSIGKSCRIGPNVSIDSKTTISNDCEVSNAVIFGESELLPHSHVHRSIIYDSDRYDMEL